MIISVASGKGGTGKTLVATSLALSIKSRERVQFFDCDVEEPNAHIFLKPDITKSESVTIPVPEVDKQKCNFCGKCAEVCAYHAIAIFGKQVLVFPNLCHGCGACSYLCPENAIKEREREVGLIESGHSKGMEFVQGKLIVGEAMSTPVIKKVKEKAINAAIVIIDVPPGTSCPVVETVKGSDFCLLVTEPTPFGLNDLELAVETVRELDIPCSVVINRSVGEDEKVLEYCSSENIPVLLTIPLDKKIAWLYSRGITLADGIPGWQASFAGLIHIIRKIINERASLIKR
ncbi:ATP-binding protein [Chloroflexota bacterium]